MSFLTKKYIVSFSSKLTISDSQSNIRANFRQHDIVGHPVGFTWFKWYTQNLYHTRTICWEKRNICLFVLNDSGNETFFRIKIAHISFFKQTNVSHPLQVLWPRWYLTVIYV